MHGRADMSEVTRIADNFDIRIPGGDLAEYSERGIAGRIIDEDMLVAIPSKTQHQVAHPFVDLADIAFLVETRRDHADGFHLLIVLGRSAHLPPLALAA